ncbi:MAG: tRNA (adenosine(37)-N6)-threonylcarbamoyltransferase complex transferase subunit TsaD [Candidatus Phytoplasma stylosanthis]|uniref:tRNA (adenosine(37)-N6)-threonylcarbamoyltransferase complex transferase subunit TsaD n=1 Tax=Candidatus Phytoplasma stylosanthis TaxID=2798314 RepID=UPI00293B3217|nr:tRNA (adenosine(37)-N6)-threonylcarbamoyltransferase complex transferase subunit TsaD [Candidatus Phytoplasma stylosanthis]MDV3167773.1 tRNA (adenosine(37)-N6)-threonylcarbamoyltransferase complex transferase subunit TsaD [Candidatus Phytoplasma stylosanthis]MDV3170950.1 tRNA (adenosine(37)-N6)-threonylcarbamoyltransferase complex transferase subunit TsaD [Candidatus Phytoplasma stylosanthis]MDV3173537.1 tRNA (adenosine(37)-N6)-threonylcarbamoyltransferase complex transferase subunit TsaD [Ca
MIVLSIETSCDETSIAVTENGKKVLSNVVFSQIKYHQKFGGVLPEIASRKHVEVINFIFKEALKKAKITIQQIDLIAVTEGPGLIGSLFAGINAANVLAYIHDKPLIGVNHLIGHLYAAQIEYELKFPSLIILISGGHTELLYLTQHFKIKKIGSTLDDAVGEVYDKIAKSLNLGYPGGSAIEKLSLKGKDIFSFSRPYLKNKNLNFSFSGLKSQIINFINEKKDIKPFINDICASFQKSITDVLIHKTKRALSLFPSNQLVIVGGVASNKFIKESFRQNFSNLELVVPSPQYCTDQAAMIGIAAYFQNIFSNYKGMKRYDLTGKPNLSLSNF